MSVLAPADKLKNSKLKNPLIQKEITQILSCIASDIKTAYRKDTNCVDSAVPITFNIPNMTNTVAQGMIYYGVLQALLDKKYHVQLIIGESKSVFRIKWLSEEEENTLNLQKLTLAKHTIIDSNFK